MKGVTANSARSRSTTAAIGSDRKSSTRPFRGFTTSLEPSGSPATWSGSSGSWTATVRNMGDREPCLRRRQYVLLALEELEIGLNVFNELDDADFSRYSSPTGEKYRSSSSETGRPAATPLRSYQSRKM